MTSYYSNTELFSLGLKAFGDNVRISRKTSIYTPEKITIGNNVRIDDFCIISGNVLIGNYVHIAAACLLFGGNDGIVLEDYTGISSRSAVYAESDDYSGCCFTNPMCPDEFRNIIGGGVFIKKHVIIGSGCTILPGTTIGYGSAVGSMSLVNKTLGEWGIYAGIPAKRIKDREKDLIELEKKLVS